MLGAIAGDIIGSVYERQPIKTVDFDPLFHPWGRPTDDTVLTVALADSILSGDDLETDFIDRLREYFLTYPHAGYGGNFVRWAMSRSRKGYNSWGNGSAMRVSPIGFAYDSLEEVLDKAKASAEVTHNHPEGVKGARATAATIFLARHKTSKEDIRRYIQETFHYDLDRTLDEIRPHYQFDVSCQGSVPESILAFLESNDYEDAVRKAISLGGDSDTMACIAGGIAEAYYGSVPDDIKAETWMRLPKLLQRVVREFTNRYR
ncbi:MAG TPA: ADP-ribosylglycohydrolase family protein [Gemmataceae bacterium]|jgi:ADP-ribosylglycohydrolase